MYNFVQNVPFGTKMRFKSNSPSEHRPPQPSHFHKLLTKNDKSRTILPNYFYEQNLQTNGKNAPNRQPRQPFQPKGKAPTNAKPAQKANDESGYRNHGNRSYFHPWNANAREVAEGRQGLRPPNPSHGLRKTPPPRRFFLFSKNQGRLTDKAFGTNRRKIESFRKISRVIFRKLRAKHDSILTKGGHLSRG